MDYLEFESKNLRFEEIKEFAENKCPEIRKRKKDDEIYGPTSPEKKFRFSCWNFQCPDFSTNSHLFIFPGRTKNVCSTCYKNYLLKEFVQVLEIEKALEEKFWLESLYSLNFRDCFELDILKFFLENIKEKFPDFPEITNDHPDFLNNFSGKNSENLENFEEDDDEIFVEFENLENSRNSEKPDHFKKEDNDIFVVFENLKNSKNSEKLDRYEKEDDEIFVVFENLGNSKILENEECVTVENWEKCELCKQKVSGRFMEFFHENAKIEVCRFCYGQLQRGLLFESELLKFSKNFGIPKKPDISRKELEITKSLVSKKTKKRRNRKIRRNKWQKGIFEKKKISKKPKIQEPGKSGKFGRRGRPKKSEKAEIPQKLHSKVAAEIVEIPNLEIDESEKSGIRKIENQIFAENFLLEIEQIEKLPVLQLDDVDFQNEPKESGNCGPKPGPKRMIAQLFQI